jgi:hypothetical protein
MEKILRGVVHGNHIELLEELDLADGTSVRVRVTPATLPPPPPGLKTEAPVSVGGILADVCTEEDDRIFEEIQRDRKRSRNREIVE